MSIDGTTQQGRSTKKFPNDMKSRKVNWKTDVAQLLRLPYGDQKVMGSTQLRDIFEVIEKWEIGFENLGIWGSKHVKH